MLGTIVNTLAIFVGSLLGIVLGKAFPEKIKNTLIQGVGLAVLLIGMQMAIKTEQMLVVILSLVIGALVGEGVDIEKHLENLGKYLEERLSSIADGNFAKGFVTASLLYCVGAMAVVGALEGGLADNHEILFAKAFLDGITAIVFASALGIGVMFSGFCVFLYQGVIVMTAGLLQGILSTSVVAEMSAVGGLLIIGIAINMLQLGKIKIGNLLPAIFIVIPFLWLAEAIAA